MFKKTLIALVMCSTLAGCEIANIEKSQKDLTEVVNNEVDLAVSIRENTARKYKYVRHQPNIFVPPVESEDLTKPNWWFDIVNAKGSRLPLRSAINAVMDDRPINVKYEDGIDKNTEVTFHGKTVGEALESIKHASGYSYQIQSDNVLTWSKFQTKSFKIAALPSVFEFALGKQGGGTNSSNENVSSGDEFASTTANLDPLDELLKELKTYSSFRDTIARANTGEEGIAQTEDNIPIYLNRSSSTITVRDVPHVVAQMAEIIKERNNLYRTQVKVDIEIIQVKLENEFVKSFDLQLAIKELTDKGVSITGGILGSTGTTFAGRWSGSDSSFGLGATVNNGRVSGTTALVELLNSKGKVTTHTMPTVIAHHNSIAKLRDLDRIKYILERSTTSTSNVGTEQSITQADLDVGFSMYLVPTVFESDISIAMATNLSNLIELQRNGDSTVSEGETGTATYVESPYTTDKDFFNRFTVRTGETMFFAGLSRSNKQIRNANAGTDVLGFSDYATNERVETIIAITPRIMRPSSI